MSKKWYNLFVSVDESTGRPDGDRPEGEGAASPLSAAQAVADIARSVGPPPAFTAPVNDPGSFAEIYQAAEIHLPPHGFTIEKVAEMLGSEHIRSLPRDVKRSSVLVALDAVGVPIQDNCNGSKRAPAAPESGPRAASRAMMPSTVPSFGATLKM